MAREKRPSFPFYPKDWLGSASVSSMPLAAQGLYIRLLAFAWLSDGLPSDSEALRRLAGVERAEWRKLWPVVSSLWEVVDGRLQNRKLETVREEATAYSEARALAGKHGGLATARAKQTASKAASKATANEAAKTQPSSSSSSSTLSEPSGSESERARALARRVVDFDPNDPGPSPTRRRRLHAAWEGVALYVTTQQHQDFVGRLTLGGMAEHEADRDLRAWYVATEDAMRAARTVPGENILRFWDEQFAARPDVARSAPKAASSKVTDGWADGLVAGGAR
jgi:uncharacterized protein YdaU (DUF1376 family)